MKKLVLSLICLLSICFVFTGCNNSKNEEVFYTVTLKSDVNPYHFDGKIDANDYLEYNGVYKTLQIEENHIIGDIEIFENEEYKFEGWFADISYKIQWNTAQDSVKANITLYAKWSKNTKQNNSNIEG